MPPPYYPQRGGPAGGKRKPGAAVIGGKAMLGGRRFRTIKKDCIRGITKPDIRRLARRGGVKRMSTAIYDEVRLALTTRLKTVLRDCVMFADYSDRKTVTVNDVIFALKRLGTPVWGFDNYESLPYHTKRLKPRHTS